MITLFIDTNVLLSFYHLTSEDIEELKKLVALVEKKEIDLIVTKQVENEFWRNRGAKIVDAMKKLREAKFNASFPAFSKDYDEYSEIRELLKKADKLHATLVGKITEDAESMSLKADEIVARLITSSVLKRWDGSFNPSWIAVKRASKAAPRPGCSTPTLRFFPSCCAPTGAGHAAVPASPAMNSRRFMTGSMTQRP
jgi:predicted nucleic acid-binding protein